jgi:hypothetical protein
MYRNVNIKSKKEKLWGIYEQWRGGIAAVNNECNQFELVNNY